ncbi:hypothetical protein CLV48_105196 [Cecembia rubra]|uniref:Uncharacterized protein n=1 Tax=Cecembia rubra TaxID=1485585 RepID=A0A2P8E4Q8_9BACT|nr:hypothetical protein CLV48_105196 [Cecembia rubra]
MTQRQKPMEPIHGFFVLGFILGGKLLTYKFAEYEIYI